jgi:hypothetical protein
MFLHNRATWTKIDYVVALVHIASTGTLYKYIYIYISTLYQAAKIKYYPITKHIALSDDIYKVNVKRDLF